MTVSIRKSKFFFYKYTQNRKTKKSKCECKVLLSSGISHCHLFVQITQATRFLPFNFPEKQHYAIDLQTQSQQRGLRLTEKHCLLQLSILTLTPIAIQKNSSCYWIAEGTQAPPPEKDSLQLPWKLSEKNPAALIPVAIFSSSYIYIHITLETATTTTKLALAGKSSRQLLHAKPRLHVLGYAYVRGRHLL